MKRMISVIAAIACMAIVFSSCGNKHKYYTFETELGDTFCLEVYLRGNFHGMYPRYLIYLFIKHNCPTLSPSIKKSKHYQHNNSAKRAVQKYSFASPCFLGWLLIALRFSQQYLQVGTNFSAYSKKFGIIRKKCDIFIGKLCVFLKCVRNQLNIRLIALFENIAQGMQHCSESHTEVKLSSM